MRLLSFATLLITMGAFGSIALAGSVSSIVVYGDSLSDNGNLFALTTSSGVPGQPGAPYYMGRFSNGPVAVEQMATATGAKLYDFAFGGATTGIGNIADNGTPTSLGYANVPGMLTTYNATKSSLTPLLGGLFVVWGGPDDLLSPSPLDGTPAAIISRSVSDILAIVAGLRAQGATNILVPGMADLGLTPAYSSNAATYSALSLLFNTELQAALAGTGAIYFNTAGLLDSVVQNPSAYGFTDVTDPCYNGATVCANPSQYLFFDSLHPTTAADSLLAQAFIAADAPEPGFLIPGFVLLAAFAGIAARRKRTVQP